MGAPVHRRFALACALVAAGAACVSRERYAARVALARAVNDAVQAWKEGVARDGLPEGERLAWVEAELLRAEVERRPIPASARVTTGVERADGSRATRETAFALELERTAAGRLEVRSWKGGERTEVSLPAPWFDDRTEPAGLRDRHRRRPTDRIPSRIILGDAPGAGAAALDFDGDGWTDLFCVDGVASVLYRNRGDGTFEDRTEEAGIGGISGNGVVAGDLDGDGRADLVVLSYFDAARVFRNAAGGRFVETTVGSRLRIGGRATSGALADVDLDGDLDLYVCRAGDYAGPLPNPPFLASNGEPDSLYLNRGDGTFVEGTEAAGVRENRWSLGCAFADLDGDGAPDLYVANDFGPNTLFRNRGDGVFREAAKEAGALDYGFGMGVGVGDYDGDGDLDLYVSNIHSSYAFFFEDPDLPLPLLGRIFRSFSTRMLRKLARGNTLLRNDGRGRFEDATDEAGVARAGWGWSSDFVDVDADGDLDAVAPNGLLAGEGDAGVDFWGGILLHWEERLEEGILFDPGGRGLHGDERNRLFENLGNGTFREVGFPAGADERRPSHCLVVADFDRDGFPDLYLRNPRDRGTLYANRGNANRRLALALDGIRSNRDAVGAFVSIESRGRRQVREARAGNAFFGSHDRTLLVGLGADEAADVRVRWPSGLDETFPALEADFAYRIVEGAGRTVRLAPLGGEP